MSWLSNELRRITLSCITVNTDHAKEDQAPQQSHEVLQKPKWKHTHTPKTHTGNSFWQPGDTASWCSDAVGTAEMSTTSDSKFIKRTHLHFNLECQANMHSFALKGIPIIEQIGQEFPLSYLFPTGQKCLLRQVEISRKVKSFWTTELTDFCLHVR